MTQPWQLATRQYDRVRTPFFINKIAGEAAFVTRVRDISAGGMYLFKLLEPTLDASHQFTVEMQLPGMPEVIWAEVEVVRHDLGDMLTQGYAVRFLRISETDRRLIHDYVREQQRH